MTHLRVRDQAACGASSEALQSYQNFDQVTCTDCRNSVHGCAAERMLDAEAHYTALRMQEASARSKRPRILGTLGDPSKVDPTASVAVRLRTLHSTFSDAEKVEAFRRITDMAADTCPGCGGSIQQGDHTPNCLGSDPLEWELSDAETQAEIELTGHSPAEVQASFNKLLSAIELKRTSKVD